MPCNAEYARKLPRVYAYSQYFWETDFTLAEKPCLEKVAFLNHCRAISHLYSAAHLEEPSSSEGKLHFLIPTKIYSKKSITSLTDEHIPIQSDTCLSSVISHNQSLPAETNTFSKEDTSFRLGSANERSLVEILQASAFKFFPKA